MDKLKFKSSFLKRNLLLFIILLFVVFMAFQKDDVTEKSEKIDENCSLTFKTAQSLIPEAEDFELIDENCFFRVFDSSGNKIGTLLNAPSETEDPSGFGGKVEVFVLIDKSNRVSAVFQGKNSETCSYIAMLKDRNFYKNWNGLKIEKAIEKEVDTVTGATTSSNAIKEMVKKNLNLYEGKTFPKISESKSLDFISTLAMLFFILSVLFFFFPGKTKKFRIILIVLSVLIPGVSAVQFSSMEIFENWLKNGLSTSTVAVFIITATSMLLSLWKKRNIYCYYYCPMGSLQELIYKVPLPKLSVKPSVFKALLYIRTVFLLLIIVFMLTELFDDYSVFEPFSAFRINTAAISSIIILILSTLLSVLIPRPWCRICPTGKIFQILKNFRKQDKHKEGDTD